MGVWLFVVAILVVIMVHESGHFIVAKAFDFKATKFFLGFGPTVWSFTRGETEYGVKALPLGGFVKITGMNPYEDVPPEDRARSYPNKPRWQRALVLVAGSATHWLVVLVLLVPTMMFIGLPSREGSNKLYSLQTKSPAAEAGLRPGDRIVGVGGTRTESWARIRSFIRDHGGETVTFTIEHDGKRREVTADLWWALYNERGRPVDFAPRRAALARPGPGEELVGFFGVAPEPIYDTAGPAEAIGRAARRTWLYTELSVRGIGDVFGQVFDGRLWSALSGEGRRAPGEGPLGIVGASRIADETFAKGQYLALIELIASFTIFVGLMNLLPLPPLDGGHLAVIAYEAVTKRTVDLRKLIPIAAAVISFFVLLFLAVLYLDLARPIKIPF
jgi:membrane-associated protease RseP (regulator of RpoE activity)